jgi:hypothetical protein
MEDDDRAAVMWAVFSNPTPSDGPSFTRTCTATP